MAWQGMVAGGTRKWPALLVWVAGSAAVVLWAYWTTLAEAAERWALDPQYSHGYLVPLFALALLGLRRNMLAGESLQPSWWGVPVLAAGFALRTLGTYYFYVWFDAISLLPCLAGLCLLFGGGKALRWSWPAIAFLAFMVPLPYQLEIMMGGPLQRVATTVSTFLLQTLGYPALSEGTVILLNEIKLNIVEACSGLRMLVIFFALSSAVALLIRRRPWERALILASAIPIALLVNVVRITVTGILYDAFNKQIAEAVFHDLAGWLMMPLALAILGLELLILKHLLLEAPPGMGQFGLAVPAGPSHVAPPRRRARRATWNRPAVAAPAPSTSEQG